MLLILNCCHEAQAASETRKTRIIPRNVELLAAGGMNVQTPEPGKHSFTSKFIQELNLQISSTRSTLVSNIHGSLLQDDRGLNQTPVRTALLGKRETNRLQKLEPQSISNQDEPETSSMMFRMSLKQDPTVAVLDRQLHLH